MKIDFKCLFERGKEYYKKLTSLLFDVDHEWSEQGLKDIKDLKKQISLLIKFTFIIIGLAIGFFVLWGSFARLDSATIAPGFVVLRDNHKTIQHLEGGVIDRILVKEGDLVEEDQPLIILNDTAAKARLQMVLSQLRAVKAMEYRLLAEQCNDPSVNYANEIFDSNIPEVQKIIKTQDALLKTRLKSVQGKLDIFRTKDSAV